MAVKASIRWRSCAKRDCRPTPSRAACLFSAADGEQRFALVYDGQGFWLAQKRLSKGRFRWWPEGRSAHEVARSLAAHQLQVLLAAADPSATQAAPAWRPVSVVS